MKTLTRSELKRHLGEEHSERVRERIQELFADRESITPLNVLDAPIPANDRIWVLTYTGMLEATTLRHFARACVQEVEHLHPACKDYLNVLGAYLDGKGTKCSLNITDRVTSVVYWATCVAASAAASAADPTGWAASVTASDIYIDAGAAARERQVEILRVILAE